MSLDSQWEPKIVGFCCNWCSYAGADLAGLNRLSYSPTVRIVRVPCSGRVNPAFIIRAFQRGADAVLVSGCHPGDCHYVSGNYHARRRFLVFKRLLEYVGFEGERLQVRWISGSEGAKFAQTVDELDRKIKALGPNKKMRQEPPGFSGVKDHEG
ncbi:hydrogenase iron-sulfur subunit [Desulfovirgula thermocuniculi]|uniref:hydrogenase iron-sulfur subunit n=1 Tax=Desulfovirgula thermocuniculi TaxID=348842 RepID=UPI000428DF44|nr:hydrogenase iron-sulfur subunit [Desulfovirgula thermocuniculi]